MSFFLCRSLQKMFALEKFVASNGRIIWGWLFLIIGAFSFTSFLYAAVISKLQPPSHNVIIRAIQNDWYYCFLIPMTLPILFVAVYFHWLSMKLFKHA
ncbi:uncharacterized protein LOC125191116 isoform X2 [Salvia hispanica]|uniref:uncharacterized protein LOC125191116 isoform X2 n=1 Tax=Salvia hispanica TaxID=49212 RepID=UPI002009C41E|nr:uncharacterized protein LOC125191116 isoform X2 [Salvia hispanica]